MNKKIVIKKSENQEVSILPVLKSLYMDGTEINSLDDIEVFNQKYKEDETIEIKLTDEALGIFNNYFANDEIVKYEVI